jgi:Family of unknown function (DUF5681)
MSYASENAPKPAREKGRFAKGSSGNPLGRPKKERGEGRLADRVDSVINRMVKVREGEHVREVPKIDALIEKVLNEAIAGDHQSRRELIDLLRQQSHSSQLRRSMDRVESSSCPAWQRTPTHGKSASLRTRRRTAATAEIRPRPMNRRTAGTSVRGEFAPDV